MNILLFFFLFFALSFLFFSFLTYNFTIPKQRIFQYWHWQWHRSICTKIDIVLSKKQKKKNIGWHQHCRFVRTMNDNNEKENCWHKSLGWKRNAEKQKTISYTITTKMKIHNFVFSIVCILFNLFFFYFSFFWKHNS